VVVRTGLNAIDFPAVLVSVGRDSTTADVVAAPCPLNTVVPAALAVVPVLVLSDDVTVTVLLNATLPGTDVSSVVRSVGLLPAAEAPTVVRVLEEFAEVLL